MEHDPCYQIEDALRKQVQEMELQMLSMDTEYLELSENYAKLETYTAL